MTYAQALDESLCYGWIDGVRWSLDRDSYTIRFTPRRPRSIWSRINVGHVQRLIREGRMARPGLIAFQKRDRRRTGIYSFERRPMELSVPLGRKFRSQKTAWTFFQHQPPGYRRICTYWVMSAKREETRRNRLDVLIDCSERGRPIPALARGRIAAGGRKGSGRKKHGR